MAKLCDYHCVHCSFMIFYDRCPDHLWCEGVKRILYRLSLKVIRAPTFLFFFESKISTGDERRPEEEGYK